MCGIVGYIGNKKAMPILIEGLLKLEYRGYDSAGIATIEANELAIKQVKGRVKKLYELDGINNLNGTIGIAHTRWATHGKPSTENAHPHFDMDKSFAVVHNGIIENYHELKEKLQEKGFKFYSQTDTEIIPNLISYYYNNDLIDDEKRVLRAIKNACLELKGSFALEIISKYLKDKMVVVRKDSPLVIGIGNDENYISSDIPAILSYTKNFYLLDDLEFALISKNNVCFFDISLNQINKEIKKIKWDADAASKNGYEDYMLKEIHEQPQAIRETIDSRLPLDEKCKFDDLDFSYDYLSSIKQIYIVACGTANYASLSGKFSFEKLCKIRTNVEFASEFRYRDPILDENTLCIFVSQSGETADTIAALRLAKKKHSKTIAISNVIGSSIAREADYTVYTHAGPEIAVASTKAYTSQVILLHILAIYFAEILNTQSPTFLQKLKQDIMELPAKIEATLNNISCVKDYADRIFDEKNIFFIGRGIDYPTAVEGSLKLKEISYIHSEAYAAGELKHGPIALIEDDTTVVAVITDATLAPKTISNLQEVISRRSKILVVTSQDVSSHNFDMVVNIPETNTFLSPILAILPLQLLAYFISKQKGLDVDKPRNLAKSVTVE